MAELKGSDFTDRAMRTEGSERVTRLTLLAFARGYCMVRVKGCSPFVMPIKQWLELPPWRWSPDETT